MFEYFSCPQNLRQFSSRLLVAGVLLLSSGVAAAYGDFVTLGIGELVGAHVLIIVGPTLFKLGYVMRLAAQEILTRGTISDKPCETGSAFPLPTGLSSFRLPPRNKEITR